MGPAPVWRSVDDFRDGDITWILDRAEQHRDRALAGSAPAGGPPVVVGLLFLEASLRTRTGFTAAAVRLGMGSVTVAEQRQSEISMAESVGHTLRTLSGYCDIIVARMPQPLSGDAVPAGLRCPLVSGGDRGEAAEHPTQALIDLFALRAEFGAVQGLRVVVCGDPKMRSVASLLRSLVRLGVGSIALLTTDSLLKGLILPPQVKSLVTVIHDWDEAGDADVVYVAGIPHQAVPLDERDRLRVTPEALALLSDRCVVTSPLPVIDEIDAAAWPDRRIRAFEHSDAALFVRMAVLEFALTHSDSLTGSF